MSKIRLPFCALALGVGAMMSCSSEPGESDASAGAGGSNQSGNEGGASQGGSDQGGSAQGGSDQGGSAQGGSDQDGQAGAPSDDPGDPFSFDVCRDTVLASPQGAWLAFGRCAGDETDGTYLLEVATGDIKQVSTYQANQLVFTPDESRLVIRAQDRLLVANTSGTPTPTTFDEAGSANWAMVTPDSSTLIWATGRKKIHARALDGSSDARVLHSSEVDAPMLSANPEGRLLTPDGQHLVFGEEGSMALHRVVPVDGSAPSKLISALELQVYPSSLTDTRIIALSKDGSAVKVEDIELENGDSTIVADSLLSAVSADATGIHFGQGHEIHRWQRGGGDPVKICDSGGQHYFKTPDGQTLFWYGLTSLHSVSADGSSGVMDVLDHGGVIGSFYGFGEEPTDLVILTATGEGEHGIYLADLATGSSGQLVEASGATKVGATVAFNGTHTHVLYFTRESGSDVNRLRAAPVATREPVTVAEGVWAWGRVPESPRVYYYTDVDGITDVLATLHVVVP